MKPRKKVVHYNIPGHAHFLTFSCYRHRPYLSKHLTRKWLIEAIELSRTKWNFLVWAYVIMPDHVHLIVYPGRDQYSISGFIKTVKQSVSRKARFFLEANNPSALKEMIVKRGEKYTFRYWQTGPGYDRNIIKLDTLTKNIDYIHNNPVRKKLVKSVLDWGWSSARWYAGHKDVLLKMDPITW